MESPPPMHQGVELAPGVYAPAAALRWQFSRSGGPGGQNVNKLNTKAELWVPLASLSGLDAAALDRLRALAGRRLTIAGEIHIQGETARTTRANEAHVLDRLRELLVRAKHRPKPRLKTRPTKASKRRRLDNKRHRAQTKSLRHDQAD